MSGKFTKILKDEKDSLNNGIHYIESVLINQVKIFQVYSISIDKCTNVKNK